MNWRGGLAGCGIFMLWIFPLSGADAPDKRLELLEREIAAVFANRQPPYDENEIRAALVTRLESQLVLDPLLPAENMTPEKRLAIEHEVGKRYLMTPEKLSAAAETQCLKRYPMAKVGDQVEFRYTDRAGQHEIRGKFEGYGSQRRQIWVSGNSYAIIQIEAARQLLFDERLNAETRARHISRVLQEYKTNRNREIAEELSRHMREIGQNNYANGYILEQDEWRSARQILDDRIRQRCRPPLPEPSRAVKTPSPAAVERTAVQQPPPESTEAPQSAISIQTPRRRKVRN